MLKARFVAISPQWVIWAFLFAITAAELLTSLLSPRSGLIAHALILIGTMFYGLSGPQDRPRSLLVALSLAPLIRLLSLGFPLHSFPQLLWYPLVSTPLLAALWMILRELRLPYRVLGLRLASPQLQFMIALSGLGLGAIEYAILRPAPLITDLSWSSLWLPALIMLVFTGFTEEVIFRGLLQTLALPVLGRSAIVYISLLFAGLHIGHLSVVDILFVFVVGVLFGYIVLWSGSIVGVTVAHGLTNCMLFLIMPLLARENTGLLTASMPYIIWGGSIISLVAIGALGWRARHGAIPNALWDEPLPAASALRPVE